MSENKQNIKVKVSQLNPMLVSKKLIVNFSVDGFQTDAELELSKEFSLQALFLVKEVLDLGGTNEEKKEFVNKCLNEIPKFISKKEEGDNNKED